SPTRRSTDLIPMDLAPALPCAEKVEPGLADAPDALVAARSLLDPRDRLVERGLVPRPGVGLEPVGGHLAHPRMEHRLVRVDRDRTEQSPIRPDRGVGPGHCVKVAPDLDVPRDTDALRTVRSEERR